ncbi:MAG TPA: hypothetical protein VG709_04065, partial [Actinomycetota bacterium]|nr:hypothetical protein [Actinomycetota bacterium]
MEELEGGSGGARHVRGVWRIEERSADLACLDEVVCSAHGGDDLPRDADASGELLVRKRRDGVDREAAKPRLVETHVAAGQIQLLEVTTDGFGREALLAQIDDRGRA